ncbi:MAG: hypothetical protein RIQ79_123, partial [Verrucomicrobiota bacterium]
GGHLSTRDKLTLGASESFVSPLLCPGYRRPYPLFPRLASMSGQRCRPTFASRSGFFPFVNESQQNGWALSPPPPPSRARFHQIPRSNAPPKKSPSEDEVSRAASVRVSPPFPPSHFAAPRKSGLGCHLLIARKTWRCRPQKLYSLLKYISESSASPPRLLP